MRGNTIEMLLEKGRVGWADSLYQYDYGQRLILTGVDLPVSYEVHFSNQENGQSKTMIGDSTGVDIPDEYLLTGKSIHVWVYLHDGTDDGETEYHGIIGVTGRAQPTDQPPTPVQQDVITQTIAALNAGVEAAEEAQEAAETAQQAWENMSATAETLPEGSAAMASYASGVLSIGVPVGATGTPGHSPVVTASKSGKVTTVSVDGSAIATINDGTDGTDGTNGITPNVTAGTTTTGAAGTDASVTRRAGSPDSAPIFDFTIPKGDKGDTGEVSEAELTSGLATKADLITDTASGAIASFPDGAGGMPVTSLSVAVEPVQDLHGYDSPWPAGGGKNKFDVDKMVNTSEITISNGVITVTGNSKNSTKKLSELADLDVGEAYILTANTTGSDNFIYLYGTGANVSWIFGTSKTITQEMLNALVFFYGGSGTTSQISNFMIRPASVTDATFAPYSNICPISGWTGTNVTRTGKNLLNIPSLITDTATNINSRYNQIISKIKYKPNTQYTFSCSVTTENTSKYWGINVRYTDKTSEYKWIHSKTIETPSVTTNSRKSVERIEFAYSLNFDLTVANAMLEEGASASIYEAFGSTTEYAFPSEAGTVYGGTLTVNQDGTGSLVVDKGITTLNGANMDSSSDYSPNRCGKWIVSTIKTGVLTDINALMITDVCPVNGTPHSAGSATAMALSATSNSTDIYIVVPNISSTADMRAYLNANPVNLVYPLATPITYELTALEVLETLKGVNNIWADTGDTTVTYRADTKAYINKVIAAAVAAL